MRRAKGVALAALLFSLLLPFPLAAQVRDIGLSPAPTWRGQGTYTNSWAVVVGINRYSDPRIPNLQYAESDASSMKEALLGLGFPEGNVLVLLGTRATRAEIERVLEQDLNPRMAEGDRLFFYFAGHGVTTQVHGVRSGYLLTHDSVVYEWPTRERPYMARPPALALDMRSLMAKVRDLAPRHKMLAVDSCFSGYAARERDIGVVGTVGAVSPARLARLLGEPVIQVLTAGRAGQRAKEKDEYGHGVFTHYLLKGLAGGADEAGGGPDGLLTFDELASYVRNRVSREPDVDQDPQAAEVGEGQFVFVLPGAPAPGVAPPPPPPERRQELAVGSLLAKVDSQFARQRLTMPKGDNAYETLQEVLRLDPGNRQALAKLQEIGGLYRRWAREELEKKNFTRAQGYYQRLLLLFPEDRGAQDGLEEIARAEREEAFRRAREEQARREAEARAERERLARLERERREREERGRLERERREREEQARLEAEQREEVRRAAAERERLARLQREREEARRKELERRRLAFGPPERPPGPPLVEVPAGWFLMGSNEYADERPQRRVYLDAFLIDKYPVTNEWYGRFMRATGRGAPRYWSDSKFNAPRQPVVGVTWEDARSFCGWLGRRLPTEAEWEKAARGPDGWEYPWGNEWDRNKAIHRGNSGGETHPVDRAYNTHASPYGAVDMSGNVWQWVADWYDEKYYQRAPERNLKGPESGQYRVLRGGSWNSVLTVNFRAAYRIRLFPVARYDSGGFRCAKAP